MYEMTRKVGKTHNHKRESILNGDYVKNRNKKMSANTFNERALNTFVVYTREIVVKFMYQGLKGDT